MHYKGFLVGIVFLIFGVWLFIVQAKKLSEGVADTLGGNRSLLMIGIGLVIIGIMVICQHI